jgi:hypothetical protein
MPCPTKIGVKKKNKGIRRGKGGEYGEKRGEREIVR